MTHLTDENDPDLGIQAGPAPVNGLSDEMKPIQGPTPGIPAQPEVSDQQRMDQARQVLGVLLEQNDGCVSSHAVRKTLEEQGVEQARELVTELRFFDSESDECPTVSGVAYRHSGRSFYTDVAYQKLLREKEKEAEAASSAEDVGVGEDVEHEPKKRVYRQEEARLVSYVKSSLENAYATEFARQSNTRSVLSDVTLSYSDSMCR